MNQEASNPDKEISLLVRLLQMALDIIITAAIVGVGAFVFFVLILNIAEASRSFFMGILFYILLMLSVIPIGGMFLNKDLFFARGPGKMICNLIVLDHQNKTPATPLQCLLRNLTILIAPIEIVFAVFSPKRRLGDFLAGTEISTYVKEKHVREAPTRELISSLLLGAAFVYFSYMLIKYLY